MKTPSRITAALLLVVCCLLPAGCATQNEPRPADGSYPGVKHRGWAEWEEDHYNAWWQSVMQ